MLVDYNQNAWGRTLASVYSLRPEAARTVSTPLDVGGGRERRRASSDFRIDNVPARIERSSATCGSRCSRRADASTLGGLRA